MDLRYDRQVRLWGDDGQSAIGNTTVCVIGSSALCTEILKNLVLAGIDSFCIIDDELVEQHDLGTNFFVERNDIGKQRAEVVLNLLKELNPRVQGKCVISHPLSLDYLSELLNYSVVVATNLSETDANPISEYLFDKGIPFIHTRVYGFLGLLRICVKEHPVVNTHSEQNFLDLRLDKPFPALAALIDSIDIEKMTYEQVRHLPYLLLYGAALKEYKKLHPCTPFPTNYAERRGFLSVVNTLQRDRESGGIDENFDQAKINLQRSILPTDIPEEVAAILADAKCKDDSEAFRSLKDPFWIMCTAMRRFVDRHGVLPVGGQLPDMASDSATYGRLSTVYHEKAMEDAEEVLREARLIERQARADAILEHMSSSSSAEGGEDESMEEEEAREDDVSTLSINSDGDRKRDSDGKGASPSSSSSSTSISREACLRFCKNSRLIRLQRGSRLDSWNEQGFRPVIEAISQISEPVSPTADAAPSAVWLLLMRAVDRFNDGKHRYPGTNGIPCDIDARDLWERVIAIIEESIEPDAAEKSMTLEYIKARVPFSACSEMCRYAASEVHCVASLMGGVAAQEVIKLATRQYIPVDNTFVYDAHSATTQMFKL